MKNKRFWGGRTLSNLVVVLCGVLLYMALLNFSAIRQTIGWFFGVLSPFITAIGFAYILNMPMRFFENRVFKKFKRKRVFSIVTTYLLFFILVALLLGLVIPQVWDSVLSVLRLASNIPAYLGSFNNAIDWVSEQFNIPPAEIQAVVGSYKDIVNEIAAFLRGALPGLLNLTMQIGSSIVGVLTALIASVYMLASKEKLLIQCKRVLYALLPEKKADETMRVAGLSNGVFSGFISGKLLDSAIIGIICFVFMWGVNAIHSATGWLVPMPFAPLVSIVVGITNVIPFFGPFIGAIPSVFILLLVNPWSALWFIVFIIVLQQFDGNILGPKILGDSTGLPAFWVLVAIIVGGGLFGFNGMLLGVPTVAVLYTLASDFIAHRLAKKGLDLEDGQLSLYDLDAKSNSAALPSGAGGRPEPGDASAHGAAPK